MGETCETERTEGGGKKRPIKGEEIEKKKKTAAVASFLLLLLLVSGAGSMLHVAYVSRDLVNKACFIQPPANNCRGSSCRLAAVITPESMIYGVYGDF